MRLDELFKSSNTLRWSKRGDKVSMKPSDRPKLHALTKFVTKEEK